MHTQGFTFWSAETHPAKILVRAGAVEQCLSKDSSSEVVACEGITQFASSSGKETCQLTLKQKPQAWEL